MTWGPIGEYYEQTGAADGFMGLPIDDEAETLASPQGTIGLCQHYEGGTAYYSEKAGAVFVEEKIVKHHELHDGVSGDLGFPVSREYDAAASSDGTTGVFQRFEGGAIYASEAHGVCCVRSSNDECHGRLGGTSGRLGFPLNDEAKAGKLGTKQDFEGGTIFYTYGYGSIAVTAATMDFIASRDGLRERLGFPVKPEEIIYAHTDYREQLFEHGMVTFRDGTRAAWLSY